MGKRIIQLFFTGLTLSALSATAQEPLLKNGQFKFRINEEGSHYVRLTFINQVWLRYTETNPGTTVLGIASPHIMDIGLRRTRLQLYGQLTDNIFLYTQFGQNNFTYLSPKNTGSYFHDATIEYKLNKANLSLGSGLTGWSGLSRYASPAIGSLLTLDAPLYQQTTNGINEQFLRKLSVYVKGKAEKLDYRLALTKPMSVSNAGLLKAVDIADFSLHPPALQEQGYIMYQFLDVEDNTLPYTTGTYLGTKRIANIGAGFIYQPKAMWYLEPTQDTSFTAMRLFGLDALYDAPLNSEKGNALTLYMAYHYLDLGPNYIRNIGAMNPANGTNLSSSLNGGGNAFPMIGTGHVLYMQAGYLFKKGLLPGNGTLQLYSAIQAGRYKRLDDWMLVSDSGINWYIHGTHGAKVSLNYQSRPVYTLLTDGSAISTLRKGMLQLQFQVSL